MSIMMYIMMSIMITLFLVHRATTWEVFTLNNTIDKHFASGHVPRRLRCPICAEASLQEDPHRRGEFDHADGGLAMVCMDFKEFVKGRLVHIVLRERSTGTTYGV